MLPSQVAQGNFINHSILRLGAFNLAHIIFTYRVVQSFEVVVYLFAQQLNVNETQNITLNSLTVVAELVRLLVIIACCI